MNGKTVDNVIEDYRAKIKNLEAQVQYLASRGVIENMAMPRHCLGIKNCENIKYHEEKEENLKVENKMLKEDIDVIGNIKGLNSDIGFSERNRQLVEENKRLKEEVRELTSFNKIYNDLLLVYLKSKEQEPLKHCDTCSGRSKCKGQFFSNEFTFKCWSPSKAFKDHKLTGLAKSMHDIMTRSE